MVIFVDVGQTMVCGAGVRAIAVASVACAPNDESHTPCVAFRAGGPDAAMVSAAASLIVVAEDGGDMVIVRRNCADVPEGPCPLEQVRTPNVHAKQVMLTGAGEWIAYVRDKKLHTLNAFEPQDRRNTGLQVTNLVGALRSGSWIIFRFRKEYGLHAFDTATRDVVVELDDTKHLRAMALGDRSIVAQADTGNGEVELFLARINPAYPDKVPHEERLVSLGTRRHVEHVAITRGRAPTDLDWHGTTSPEVPLDRYVLVTSAGASWRTNSNPDEPGQTDWFTDVYSAQTGKHLDLFRGRLATGSVSRPPLVGISAVAPDGKHLAYIAPTGALELRNVTTQRQCSVRSSRGANHRVAGFSGDGMLYFQSEDTRADDLVATDRVFAHDTFTHAFVGLSEDGVDGSLSAVPRIGVAAQHGAVTPWAVIAGERLNTATAGPHHSVTLGGPERHDSAFLALADPYLWVVNATVSQPGNRTTIRLHRIEPRLDPDTGEVSFRETSPGMNWISPPPRPDSDDATPFELSSLGKSNSQPPRPRSDDAAPFELSFGGSDWACVSIARVGEWVSPCASSLDPTPFIPHRLPASEL
ncbi:MAG: hypothetical protein V3V08_08565 [Nannocystaceae bacterium]